jgi:hypothetical protein
MREFAGNYIVEMTASAAFRKNKNDHSGQKTRQIGEFFFSKPVSRAIEY